MIVDHLQDHAEPVAAVHPYPGNPRVGDVELIKASLIEHGQFKPIVVNRPTGDILAGNHVWQAICELGWTQVAVVYVDVDEDQARKMVLVDNRAAEKGTFDDDALAELLAEVGAEELLDVGYSVEEFEELLALVDDGDYQPFTADDPGDPGAPGEPRVTERTAEDRAATKPADPPAPMDAYDQYAERASKEPQTPKGVSAEEFAILQFRDFRAKVTREAYDRFRTRMMDEHGNAAAVGPAILAQLGFAPDEIAAVKRDEHHDDRTR